MKLTEKLEAELMGMVVSAMLDAGFRVVISDCDGGGLYLYGNPDNGEAKPEGGYRHWVRMVPGNGPDYISDYTTNLESVLKPVNDYAAQFA